MPRALLIDDEEYARVELRALLAAAHPEVRIVGEAAALDAARKLIARDNYDFLFLDIRLGGRTAFELVPDLPAGKPVIFVTGYEQHAPHAFEVNALDYLLKPVRASRLAEALRRLAEQKPKTPVLPAAADTALHLGDIVPLNGGDHARFVRVADISLITAHENYCFVHLANGTKVMVRRSLKSWAGVLPSEDFVRVHRTAIVNLTHVTGYDQATARTLALRLDGLVTAVDVSRQASANVKARLLGRFVGKR